MPVLVVFMFGGAEIARFVNQSRKVTNLANSVASLVAERTADIGFYDIIFVLNSAMVTFPEVLADSARKGIPWSADITINLSSIAFTPTVSGCTSNCTYTAKVQWSVYPGGQGLRSCSGTISAVADTAAPSFTTLPQDVYNAGTIIVADIVYNYTPLFFNGILQAVGGGTSIPIRRSVYLAPRYLPQIKSSVMSSGGNPPKSGFTFNCP